MLNTRYTSPARSVRLTALLFCGVGLIATSQPASSVALFIELPLSAPQTDPNFVSDTSSFAFASADLGNQEFRARMTGTLNQSGQATAGIQPFPNSLRVTNVGTVGRLYPSLWVTGAYTLTTFNTRPLGGGSSANAFASLSVRQGSDTHTVSGFHVVNKVFDADGDVTSERNDFNPIIPAGGNLIVAERSLERLDMTLVAPTMTPSPGDPIDLWLQLRVTGASTVGIGAADFSNSAQLSLWVDPGVVLVDETGTPLTWVRTIPEPGMMWLFGGGLLALLGVARFKEIVRQPASAA